MFKEFYDEVTFNDSKPYLETLRGKVGDTKSRGLYVTVIQNNVIIDDLTGLSMDFVFLKPDGTKGINEGEVAGERFRIDYTNQVFAVEGIVKGELVLRGASGEKITSRDLTLLVTQSIVDGEIISEDERGILDRAFELAEDIIPRIELIDIDLLENVQAEIIAARTSTVTGKAYDSLGFRLDNGESKINELENLAIEYIPRKWKDVQNSVRVGLHKKAFKIGDQFITTYNGLEYPVNVIGINHDTPTDTNFTNSLTLQFHDCLMSAQFSAPQALYTAKTSELLAGQYYFEHDGVAYQFTLTQNLAIGGQLTFPWAYNTDILTTKVSSFENNISTTAIETVEITEGAAGVKLEPINDISRCRYGSNNYNESAIKQFLNSKEDVFNWQPKTTYDRLSTGVPYSGAGFLKLLDPELVKVIGAVDKEVARNTITDGGGQDLFSDKVFLLSPKEVYAFNEGTIIGEEPYQYYSMMSETITNATVDWRIKYLGSSPRNWWLRSPNVGSSSSARYVSTSGSVSTSIAGGALGVSPACVIY